MFAVVMVNAIGSSVFRVDHHMEFIPAYILLFDMVPAPFGFWIIWICWEDGPVLDDGGDAEEFFGDELLDDLVEQLVESVESDAFDDMAVVSDVRIVFESKLSSPEVVFF
jgi:hypothetical protein